MNAGQCVSCAPGTTRPAGDDPTGGDTACQRTLCPANQHVQSHVCLACPAGSTEPAGDDASGSDTTCQPTLCAANQQVQSHSCVACSGGATNGPGDDASGQDTHCDSLCAPNQHVSSGVCLACAPGTARAPGDDPSAGDTACADVLCEANQSVVAHVCTACSPGTEKPSGDDASGPDTACLPILCAADQHVQAHACTDCAAGTTDPGNDDASGADTSCSPILCPANTYVSSHVCTACPAGDSRAAGDDASQGDTSCVPPHDTWTPNRATTLLAPNDTLTFHFDEDVGGGTVPSFAGSLAGAAVGVWIDARTLAVTPNGSWSVGAASLSFTVYDRFLNSTQVSVTGNVTDAIYADVVHGDDAALGTAASPMRSVAAAMARAQQMGALFPVQAALSGSGAAADLTVTAASFQDVFLTCTNDPLAPGALETAATLDLSATGSNTAQISGCRFQDPSTLHVTAGHVVLGDVAATNVTVLAGQLDLQTSDAADVTGIGQNAGQQAVQTVATHLELDSGTLNLTNAIANTLQVSGGSLVSHNAGVFNGVTVTGGALAYHGGFVGLAPYGDYANDHAVDEPADYQQLQQAFTLQGAAAGAAHEIDGTQIYAATGVSIHPSGQPFVTDVHDSILHGNWGNAGISSYSGEVHATHNVFHASWASYGIYVTNAIVEMVDNTVLGDAYCAPTALYVNGDNGATVVGNTLSNVQMGVGRSQGRIDVSQPFDIVGNTVTCAYGGNGIGIMAGGGERIEHNVFSVGYIGVVGYYYDSSMAPTVRWNDFQDGAYDYMDFYGGGSPSVWVGNTYNASANLDADLRPTEQSSCALTRSTAAAADGAYLAGDPVDRDGLPRTWPFSMGAYEWDGACTCGPNAYVDDGECLACPAGSTNATATSTSSGNSSCQHTLCSADQSVSNHACVACAPGTARAAGDDATGSDTVCDVPLCAANQYVSNHACVACPAEQVSPAGFNAAGGDTQCSTALTAYDGVVGSGAAAYWPLDEAQGPSATDLLSHQVGVASSSGVAFGAPGIFETALAFNRSTGGAIGVPYSPVVNPSGDFSAEFWMELSSTLTDFQAPLTSRNNFTGYNFYVAPSNSTPASQIQFWTGSGSQWDVVSGPTAVVGQRYQVVGTYSASAQTMTLYVNGGVAGTLTGVSVQPNSDQPLVIGAGQDGAGGFNGMVDEVSIYPRVLSLSEVQAHFAAGYSPLLCSLNQHVAGHACVACLPGSTRPAGDDSNGPNTSCSVCATNQYISNGTCASCAQPTAGQYVSTACVGSVADGNGADTVLANCDTPAAGSYTTSACVPGSAAAVGSNTVIASCDAPPDGSYTQAACVAGSVSTVGSNTVSATCSAPAGGAYVTAVCAAGSPTSVGSDTQTATCSAPPAGSYTATVCQAGSASTLGANTVASTCTPPGAGEYVTAACVLGGTSVQGTDTGLATCATPAAGQYVTAQCTVGSIFAAGSNTALAACSEPGSGQYVSATCVGGSSSTVGTDTGLATCATPAAGQYVSSACVPGSDASLGQDATLLGCTAIASCASGLSCTTASNSTCGACASGYVLASGNTQCLVLPSPPVGVLAGASNGEAYVWFPAAATNGGPAISSYTVTSSPGNLAVTVAGGSSTTGVTLTGLTNGTPYTFTVTATNANGTSVPSAPSNGVTPQAAQTLGIFLTPLAYTGAPQTWTVPPNVVRLDLDLAGAQGGGASGGYFPGGGGRVQAKLTVTPGQTLNVYVGGQGGAMAPCSPCSGGGGGWNGGGGPGFFDPTGAFSYPWGGGGGATDIRVGGTALSNRVVVGGGGGGAVVVGYTVAPGGAGGGLVGGSGGPCVYSDPQTGVYTLGACGGGGGTQSAGGAAGADPANATYASAGSLGMGGDTFTLAETGSPGGGGYYGGGGGVKIAPGGGGSSYCCADGTATCSASSGSPCFSVTHTQGAQGGNGYANLSFEPEPLPDPPASVSAYPGNGSARLYWTAADPNGGPAVSSYTVTSSPGNLTTTVSGTTTAATVSGLTNGTAYTFTVTATSSATSAPSPASNSVTPQASVSVGKFFVPFGFTGGPQTWTVPPTVSSVTVDLAGASGGDLNGPGYHGSGYSGEGGRVQATLSVTPGATLHVYVGGAGQSAVACSCMSGGGGWNGGGGSPVDDGDYGGGGGATDIRIGGTDLAHRVIVGGGGGGAGVGPSIQNGVSASLPGGAGGGLLGGDGTWDSRVPAESASFGRGGSQSAGGAGGCDGFGAGCVGAGSLGQGGDGTLANGRPGAGGGGGYYGGGGGTDASAGGGSSYCDGVTCYSPTHIQGYQLGNGYATLTFTP